MNNKIITIIFTVQEEFIPYFVVTLKSIVDNAKSNYKYNINVLYTDIEKEKFDVVNSVLESNFTLNLFDLTDKMKKYQKYIELPLFSHNRATFYRFFIGSLFPNLHKAILLSCDVCVLTDISMLYTIDLENNILAASNDEFMLKSKELEDYVNNAVGVSKYCYFNSGVMVINLDEFRKQRIEAKFLYLLEKYNFECIAPDQDYLNFLAYGKVNYLDISWNKMPMYYDYSDTINIVHYNLYLKPWLFENLKYKEYFWEYAKKTVFYDYILEEQKKQGLIGKINGVESIEKIFNYTNKIVASNYNFRSVLLKNNINIENLIKK